MQWLSRPLSSARPSKVLSLTWDPAFILRYGIFVTVILTVLMPNAPDTFSEIICPTSDGPDIVQPAVGGALLCVLQEGVEDQLPGVQRAGLCHLRRPVWVSC